ncbi:unnamed protein product [Brassica rapa]|uniref:Uncharacterized protein n=1 Tax=Brassica campestris TaxID=3711 RepID=A0A3P5Y6R0_BRACM|nr:unnamed protein product [Brassica rapa]VDC63272.1 unnamed protein product [Brassica rapa]
MTMNSLPRRFGRDQGYLDRGRRSGSESEEELKGLSHEEYRRLKRLKMRKSGKFCICENTPSPPRDPYEVDSDENAADDEVPEKDVDDQKLKGESESGKSESESDRSRKKRKSKRSRSKRRRYSDSDSEESESDDSDEEEEEEKERT